jgi:2-polyprenyl-6-methoxyphenol hydroxylase-like FAD-dependent oxidoreductase
MSNHHCYRALVFLALTHLFTTKWNKCFSSLELRSDGVTARFEDGSEVEGNLLVACDGGQSRVRRALFPDQSETYKIPVRMLGVKLTLTPEEFEPVRQLDPFFLQGTSSQDNSFVYLSGKLFNFFIL